MVIYGYFTVELEKEMATHSSVLAWRIPGTMEPGGLPSRGRTKSDTTEVTLAAAAAVSFHCFALHRYMGNYF